jgi:hypothetical protein
METSSQDAARLLAAVERWQGLAADQQGLAIRLEELVAAQRLLSDRWAVGGDAELTAATTAIEAQLRKVSDDILAIQELVIRRIAQTISELRAS